MLKTWRFGVAGLFCYLGALTVSIHPASAQLNPDNTLGNEQSVIAPIDVNNDRIQGGAARGVNLFHSFKDFNIGEGRGVYFANPEGITDIFSRVTGGNSSNIFGRLGVLGDANLFLINPSGIVFGESGSLDIQGSFVATTADGIRFGEQGFFSAREPETPQLLTVNPSALFFNQVPSGNITVRSVEPAGTSPSGIEIVGLRVPDSRSLVLVGGDVNFEGGQSNALGGHLELGGLKEAGSINLQVSDETLKLGFPDNILLANVTLKDDARVIVRGGGGGNLVVNANTFTATNGGRLVAGTEKLQKGGDIIVNTNNFIINGVSSMGIPSGLYNQNIVDAVGSPGNIFVNTKILDASSNAIIAIILNSISTGVKGNAGDINISADFLLLRNGSQIAALNFGQGNSGNIEINADTIDLIGVSANGELNSGVFSETSGLNSQVKPGNLTLNTRILNIRDGGIISTRTSNQGKGGDLNIKASESLNISGFAPSNLPDSQFFVSGLLTSTQGSGKAGNLKISDTGTVKIEDGGRISASTFNQGAGGNIEIDADTVELTGRSTNGLLPSALASETSGVNSSAKAGDITLNTRILNIRNGGIISTRTSSQGKGGDLTVKASESLNISGISPSSEPNFPFSISALTTSTLGPGEAGNLKIYDTGTIKIEDGGRISASTFNQGAGGNIEINAEKVELIGTSTNGLFPSAVVSETSGANFSAKAGNITLDTRIINLFDGGFISTQTTNQGKGGNLTVTASESLNISGIAPSKLPNNPFFTSGLFTSTQGLGEAGNLKISDTGTIKIEDGGQISASTFNQGEGGNIEIDSDILELIGASTNEVSISAIVSETSGANFSAQAGDINLKTQTLNIRDGAVLSTQSTNQGLSGKINIQNSERIELTNGNILSISAQSSGGDINITAKDILLFDDSNIATLVASGKGSGGKINLTANTIVALDKSDILSFAPEGQGGDIRFNTKGFFSTPLYRPTPTINDADAFNALNSNNQVDVNASGTVNGAITGVPDVTFIDEELTELTDNQIDTNALIASSCIARSTNRQENSFTITGSGGLRNSPGDELISIYSTGEVRNISNNNQSSGWKKGEPIIEPQGVYRLSSGELVLSREC